MTARITRRATLAGAAVAGVPLLAACGDDAADPAASASESASSTPPSDPPTSAPSSPRPTKSPEPGPPAGAFTSTDQIPVGGGQVFADETVVVTQPTEGVFKGFSAECTHRGCLVAGVGGGTINCGCHGSRFDITDGSVTDGPAASPLPAVELEVRAGQIGRA